MSPTTSTAALQKGARAYRRQERARAIRRVVTFQRWLARGSVLREIPEIPTDHDYVVARAAGRIR